MEQNDLESTCILRVTKPEKIPKEQVTAQLDTVRMRVLACFSVSQATTKEFGLQSFPPSFLAPPFCRVNDFLTYRSHSTSYPLMVCLTADRFVAVVLHRLRES